MATHTDAASRQNAQIIRDESEKRAKELESLAEMALTLPQRRMLKERAAEERKKAWRARRVLGL
jgi:hypothetical protein